MKKQRAIFSIDIEGRGPGPLSNGIVSIGVCIGNPYKNQVFLKTRFDLLPLENQTMDKQCMNSFWSHHLDKLKLMQKNAGVALEQIKKFRNLLDKWDKTHNLYIVCDNPGYDFGFINTYLDMAKLPTLNYVWKCTSDNGDNGDNANGTGENAKLEYRNTHDSDSYARGYFGYSFVEPWISNATVIKKLGIEHLLDAENHDHMPENDAEFIYKLHYYVVTHSSETKKLVF